MWQAPWNRLFSSKLSLHFSKGQAQGQPFQGHSLQVKFSGENSNVLSLSALSVGMDGVLSLIS